MNPFIRTLRVHGLIAAGDAWARVALAAADRARACWERAGRETDRTEREFRKLLRRLRAERRDAEWERIEREIRAVLDERDEGVAG